MTAEEPSLIDVSGLIGFEQGMIAQSRSLVWEKSQAIRQSARAMGCERSTRRTDQNIQQGLRQYESLAGLIPLKSSQETSLRKL